MRDWEGQGGAGAGGWEEGGMGRERVRTGEVVRAGAVVVGKGGYGEVRGTGASSCREAEGWVGAERCVRRTARWPEGLQWKWPRVTTWRQT